LTFLSTSANQKGDRKTLSRRLDSLHVKNRPAFRLAFNEETLSRAKDKTPKIYRIPAVPAFLSVYRCQQSVKSSFHLNSVLTI
jgi:hypothetical protein